MNGKRQKQIKAFLVEEFGEEKGGELFGKQTKTLDELIKTQKNKSARQMKTLAGTILPCIALYKTLSTDGLSQEAAYVYMRAYMLDKAAAQKHASMARMEAVPGFYAIYSRIFLNVMRKSDLWESTQRREKNFFDVTIQKCLWHTACAENGCPELCRLFCDSDNVAYGGLKKLGFARTKTLGCGGDCCDFHFFRK